MAILFFLSPFCDEEGREYRPTALPCRFNAIAPTIMRKALNRTLDRIYSQDSDSPSAPPRSSRPSTATLDLLIAHSSGDIRSALMSLQFLASEGGGGHLTSLGTGAKGRGGGAKGKKGKKRKRGEEARSSDEEEGGTVGKLKNGKDRVRQLWVRLSVRTTSLYRTWPQLSERLGCLLLCATQG